MDSNSVVDVELTSEQLTKLFDGYVVSKPMRKRPVSNVALKSTAKLPEILQGLVGVMADSGYSVEDIQTLVAEHLAKPSFLR